jgi:hypothetical protein
MTYRDFSTLSGNEKWVFNTTATLSPDIPNSIYWCFPIPDRFLDTFYERGKQFTDMKDFQGAFI